MKRLLTIGHSYVVAQNRRLAHEMAMAGRGAWEVTAAAPERLAGDLREIPLEPIAGEACRLVPLPVRLGRSPHLRCYGGVRGLLREPWDVVHCWEEPYVAAGWQVSRHARPESALVFATFQNLNKSYPPPMRWMERASMARADAWIAFGRTVHEALSPRAEYAARPSRVITPGVDLEHFTPDRDAGRRVRGELGWDDGTPVVGFVGRFVPQKGIAILVSALARVAAPWRALFVGDGPEIAALEAVAASNPGRVAIARDVPHDGVADYLNAMDVLCAPSQTTPRWREQFGRMLVEAMACGVPVIASRSGEIPFVLADAATIVPEADVALWAAAISRHLSDAGLRAERGACGRERATRTFGWPKIARDHLAFFESLVEGRRA